MGKQQHGSIKNYKRGLSVLKIMAASAKDSEQRHLLLLYEKQSVALMSPTMDQASQLWQRWICKSWTECRTRQCNIASHTRNDQGHTHCHWLTESETTRVVLDLLLPMINAKQTGQSILQCHQNSPQPTPWSHERRKASTGCRLGQGKSRMGQAAQSVPQVSATAQIVYASWHSSSKPRTEGMGMVPKPVLASQSVNGTFLPERLGKHYWEWPAGKTKSDSRLTDQPSWSHSRKQQTARSQTVYTNQCQ